MNYNMNNRLFYTQMYNREDKSINFDNAATSYPKPGNVRAAVAYAMTKYGGNAGRGGHNLTMASTNMVFETRKKIADFFGAEIENIVFTYNCTHALNMAIKGIMDGSGHIIISSLEHNAVLRPVHSLSQTSKVKYSVAKVYYEKAKTLQSFRELITPETKAVACTVASNVTGQILPYKEIGELCKKHNICFIADGAQGCGVLPVKLSDGINILCTSGHKGLYGVTGTGLLISDGKFDIKPLVIQGGTGSGSLNFNQPEYLPDSLESGTMNIIGIASLKAGIDFLNKMTLNKIYAHESKLCDRFIRELSGVKGINIYRNKDAQYVPIVSFNIENTVSEETARLLNDKGFCMRAGLHCAGLAHKSIGTDEGGTVRFAPSVFNSEEEVIRLVQEIKQINKPRK